MRIARFLGVMFGIPLLAAAASAEEVIGVSEVLGPEGPLFVNGNV